MATHAPGPVLITGVTGFIGTWLAKRLVETGHVVAGTSRRPLTMDHALVRHATADRIEIIGGIDVTDRLDAVAALRPWGSVFHLAGCSHVARAFVDPAGTFEANVRGTWQLFEALRRSASRASIVIASSDAVYGECDAASPPTETAPIDCANPYEASKAAAELVALGYARAYDMWVNVVRLGNVYGPEDSSVSRIVPSVAAAALGGQRPRLRNGGRAIRTLLYIDDAVEGLISAAGTAPPRMGGRVFNICGAPPITMLEVARLVLQATDRSDLEPDLGDDVGGAASVRCASPARALAELGWGPRTPIAEGIRRSVDWTRRRNREIFEAPVGGHGRVL